MPSTTADSTTTTTTEKEKTTIVSKVFGGAKNLASVASGNAADTYTGAETFWIAGIAAGLSLFGGYNYGHKDGRNGADNKFGKFAVFND